MSVPVPDDSATPKSADLQLPEGMRYHCIQCGRSCGEFWEIEVEPEKVDEIRARDKAALAGATDPADPIVDSPWTPGKPVMRLDACGHCVLQNGQGLCSLHAAFGLESKPNSCRTFPYKFVTTPRGVFTGLSFACTAVLANEGPQVTDERAEVEEMLGWTDSKRDVPEPAGLAVDLPLSWEQYQQIEQDLSDLLDPALGPLPRRLVAQSAYLALLTKFLRHARSELQQLTAGAEANVEPLTVFRRKLRGTPEQPWPLPFSIADKRRSSMLLRRMFLGFAHALRNTYGQRRGRLRSYFMVIGTYFYYAAGRGRITLPRVKHTLAWRELSQIGFDPTRPEFDALLTRYFRHRLFRKDLLTSDYLHLGHHLMLMHWGLIHWYSALYAAEAGSPIVEMEHLREGLRNVEKFFVFHSTFDRLFVQYPMLRGFLDRMFQHPLYAFSMAHGEWETAGR
jgi:Fe-S-cluster containining protein